jgi:hypothetical protein
MVAVALVSTPWPLFNRPSIQLGTLKAFLQRDIHGITVDARHVYLSVFTLASSLLKSSKLSSSCFRVTGAA